ncbi:MAG: hypothetical protein AMXMBFR47_15930 [Planctomycetota bacterium]
MNRARSAIGIGIAFGAGAATALAQAPVGSGFTYQGQLKESGVPAGSTYDLRFHLYDAALGGALVATDCADGVVPVDGLFTVELDFGTLAFDGNARWMEVAVRVDATPGNCGGGAAYTPLSPRQPLTAVPYALYALGGPGGGGGGFWQAVGTSIMNSNTGFVGIRRATPVTGAEYFGIQAPVSAGYGGMYIRTDGANGLPFYGYRSGATGEAAWTYLDGATGDWRVNVDGDRLTVTDTGRIGIGTMNPGSAMLDIAANASSWGLRVTGEGSNSAIYTTMNGNGATASIYGTNFSNAAGAIGIHGLLSNSTPGEGSAGVRGTASSTTSNNTYGVHGRHNGAGYGVLGESLSTTAGAGVRGHGWWGVYGQALNANGYGGVFAGSGFLGSGPSLLVWGESHLLNDVGVGVQTPEARLHVNDNSDSAPSGGGIVVIGPTNAGNISMDANEIMARNNGAVSTLYLNNEGGDVRIGQNGTANCTVYVPVLAITGADVAEKFQMTGCRDTAEPGTVMEIDPDNAGKLRVASGAYNRRVAGVVSGAGDIPVGAILGNLPGHEDAPAIALSGRVWVRCDARTAAIGIGDLLTTAELPGHAMKAADPSRSHGAVIGKAMTALGEGETGLVLVLVNLQ